MFETAALALAARDRARRCAASRALNGLCTSLCASGIASALGIASAGAQTETASGPQNSSVAGDFWTEPATLKSLGFEWRIDGDDNRNATVKVSYRRVGEPRWHRALPLLRLQHESVIGGLPRDGGPNHFFHYVAPDMFAGSILNLEPDTAYEARLELTDPDGVEGERVWIVM